MTGSRRVPRSNAERRVFVDTSAFFALGDRRDRLHGPATASLERLGLGRYRHRLLTTRFVVETHARTLTAGGTDLARTFLRQFRQEGIAVVPVEDADEERAAQIIFTYVVMRPAG